MNENVWSNIPQVNTSFLHYRLSINISIHILKYKIKPPTAIGQGIV